MIRLLPLLLFGGCDWFEPALDPLTTDPMLIAAEPAWSLSTGAQMATDLAVHGDDLLVLDGYRGQILRFGPDQALKATVPLPELPHRPARLALSPAGEPWLTSPDSPVAVLLDRSTVARTLTLTHPDGSPVLGVADLLDRGRDLVVALSDGAVATADPESGLLRVIQRTDIDGEPLGAPVHLAPDGDRLLVTDTFATAVHLLDPDLRPVGRLGRRGIWIGTMGKPKAAAPLHGAVAVADSALGVVQLWDVGGKALGALSVGELSRFDHPIALERFGDVLAILDSATGTVHSLRVSSAAVTDARRAVEAWRHLRTDLLTLSHHELLASGRACLDCHDGTLLDHRQNWDPDLHHHPVDVVPPRAVPSFFPLDEGRLRCTTCHSPHGTVEVSDVQAVEGSTASELVRHAPAEGDAFTRLSREDAALCVACHTEAAHERALDAVTSPGSAHPTGAALREALEARGGASQVGLPGGIGASCLTCHDVHGATREGLLRSSASTETCAACHLEQARPDHSHPVHGRGLGAGCVSCHDLVGGTEGALLSGATPCTTCHEPLASAHARVRGAHGSSCLACHDVHEARGRHLLARTGPENDPTSCLSCHAPGARAAKPGVHPGERGHPVEGDLTCQSCHAGHTPAQTPACSTCHEALTAESAHGAHAAVACASCHPAHQARPLGRGNPRSAPCLACHGPTSEAPQIAGWLHPTPVFITASERWTPLAPLTLYDRHGEPVPTSQGGELACTTCHPTHGPAEGGGLVRPEVLRACGSCHGDEATGLLADFHRLGTR